VVGAEAKTRLNIRYARSISVNYPRSRFIDFNLPFMIISMIKQLKSVAKIGEILYFVLKYSVFCEITSRDNGGAKALIIYLYVISYVTI
jgi:hypothetical protein